MIDLFPTDVPKAAGGIAAILLGMHVGLGGIGLLSGATAMTAKKGSHLHRRSGTIFFIVMMTAAAVGAAMVPFLPKWTSLVPGLFATYLIATGWITVRRPPGQTGRFEAIALGAAIGLSLLAFMLGLFVALRPAGRLNGVGPGFFFLVALLPALSAALDFKMIRSGGLRGPRRLARHIWRMSAGMFVVAVSFFPGRVQIYRPYLDATGLLWIPPLAVIAVMAWWLAKMRRPRNGHQKYPAVDAL